MYKKQGCPIVYAGPLWDKDKSFGNPNNPMDQKEWNYTRSNPAVWDSLLANKGFCSAVWKVWTTQRRAGGALNLTTLKNYVAAQQKTLEQSNVVPMEDKLWGPKHWHSQVQTLNDSLTTRLSWIDDNLSALLKQSGFTPARTR